jgi:hypothetical protein
MSIQRRSKSAIKWLAALSLLVTSSFILPPLFSLKAQAGAQPSIAPASINADSPESAAKSLYNAYRSCSRDDALKVADPYAVKQLFGTRKCTQGAANWEFMGCNREHGGHTCSYYYEGGGVNMRVFKKPRVGYQVTSVGYVKD